MSLDIFFSVVIPTHQRNESLAKCLDCLAPGVQSLPAVQYEVIVSDDGVETTAQQMIERSYPWVKWVASGARNPAENRNNGAKSAQGEWLVFTDDDCVPESQWLEAYAAAITEDSLALEGAIHPQGNLQQDLVECPVNVTGGNFWSANIAVHRCLFEEVGGFDANYPLAAFEDQDLQLRLSALTRITFVPDAIVRHPVRIVNLKSAISSVPKRCFAYAYHANKNRCALGYENTWRFAVFQYTFHLKVFLSHLRHGSLGSALISFVMLTFGIPLVMVNLKE